MLVNKMVYNSKEFIKAIQGSMIAEIKNSGIAFWLLVFRVRIRTRIFASRFMLCYISSSLFSLTFIPVGHSNPNFNFLELHI